jgi:hypothetical protein
MSEHPSGSLPLRSLPLLDLPGVTLFAVAVPCPNDFTLAADLRAGARKSRAAAKKALQDKVDEVLPGLEEQVNCPQYTCADGKCEFDYLLEERITRVAGRTGRRGKRKIRFRAEGTLFLGCFCPDDGDDPEQE